jgi:starch phosphorylase
MDLIFFDGSIRNEPGVFSEIRDVSLTCGDPVPLADVTSCLEADQPTTKLYANPDAWARTAILNVASCGKFSSDRTIAEYAADIWKVQPCPVPRKPQ